MNITHIVFLYTPSFYKKTNKKIISSSKTKVFRKEKKNQLTNYSPCIPYSCVHVFSCKHKQRKCLIKNLFFATVVGEYFVDPIIIMSFRSHKCVYNTHAYKSICNEYIGDIYTLQKIAQFNLNWLCATLIIIDFVIMNVTICFEYSVRLN